MPRRTAHNHRREARNGAHGSAASSFAEGTGGRSRGPWTASRRPAAKRKRPSDTSASSRGSRRRVAHGGLSDGTRSRSARSTPSATPSCPRASRACLTWATYETSIGGIWVERRTSSSEGARAKASRLPGTEQGSKGNPGSCSSTFERYARSCLDASCGKTSRGRSRARTGRLSSCCSGRWMNSGTVWHGECWTRSFSAYPKDASVSTLSACLEAPPVPAKYYLSPKACLGMLRRAEKRGRPLPTRLRAALVLQASGSTPLPPQKG